MMNAAVERVYQVVFGAHVTEKSVIGSDAGIHVFRVAIGSTKKEIKTAVEALFNVKVKSVKSVNVKGKSKSFGRRNGSRKSWKKAYVRLVEGHTINMESEG